MFCKKKKDEIIEEKNLIDVNVKVVKEIKKIDCCSNEKVPILIVKYSFKYRGRIVENDFILCYKKVVDESFFYPFYSIECYRMYYVPYMMRLMQNREKMIECIKSETKKEVKIAMEDIDKDILNKTSVEEIERQFNLYDALEFKISVEVENK